VSRGSAAEKFKLSFEIYDVDKSGSISREEMKEASFRMRTMFCKLFFVI